MRVDGRPSPAGEESKADCVCVFGALFAVCPWAFPDEGRAQWGGLCVLWRVGKGVGPSHIGPPGVCAWHVCARVAFLCWSCSGSSSVRKWK